MAAYSIFFIIPVSCDSAIYDVRIERHLSAVRLLLFDHYIIFFRTLPQAMPG